MGAVLVFCESDEKGMRSASLPALTAGAALAQQSGGALVATASSTGKDILPRAAALLGAGMASDVTAVLAANRFKRPAYAGNAIEEVEVGGSVVVASIRQTAFPPSTGGGAAGAIENVA